MRIEKCSVNDLPEILDLYEAARDLQKIRKMVVWPSFSEVFILNEIAEGRQWKLVEGQKICCNWTITFNDKEIWEEKDKDDSIFVHRICTAPDFRGNRYIDHLVDWAKAYARTLGRRFIRLDTLGNNTRLIKHYTSSGFDFLGISLLTNTATLPRHYQDEPDCCLFEIDLEGSCN